MERLTPMQLECLRRAASRDKVIAAELGIAPSTVSLHIRAAMQKLGAVDRYDAMGRLAVHPLYEDIDIVGVRIEPPHSPAPTGSSMGASQERPALFGLSLPPLPGVFGRLAWVVGAFVGLAAALLMGMSLVNAIIDLAGRQAPGSI